MKLKLLIPIGAAVILALFSSGCGSGFSNTEVKVTLDGSAVENATLTFIPEDKTAAASGTVATGVTDSSGTCTLETLGKKGIPKGSYKVVVVKFPAMSDPTSDQDPVKSAAKMTEIMRNQGKGGPQNMLPAQYSAVDSTPFSITIPHSGVVKLEMKSGGGAPPTK